MKTSKRIGAVPEETKEWILTAARQEFAERGFQGSSLRRICSAAGVTTGALYFFFQGKDDLFKCVLDQVTIPFHRLMEDHYLQEKDTDDRDQSEGANEDFYVSRMLIDLYFSNQQTWDILAHHLDHPIVQAFLNRFVEESQEHYQYLLETMPEPPAIDPFAVHQFVHMQVDTMLTLITHEFNREDMIKHSKTMIRMLRGAFRAMMSDEE